GEGAHRNGAAGVQALEEDAQGALLRRGGRAGAVALECGAHAARQHAGLVIGFLPVRRGGRAVDGAYRNGFLGGPRSWLTVRTTTRRPARLRTARTRRMPSRSRKPPSAAARPEAAPPPVPPAPAVAAAPSEEAGGLDGL